MKKAILILTALVLNGIVFGQSQADIDKARNLTQEGISLVDEGKYDEGIKKYKEAEKLDPKNVDHPYEICYALVAQKKYKPAIKKMNATMAKGLENEQCYQLLGNAYDYAKKEGVITTSTGLQYSILEEGKGDMPTPADTVSVHYHGTLIDGTVFDSSISRGMPATFGVTQVIKGWTEALQLMKVGSKYRLYIPQDLAYGAHPHPGGAIKPFMALIFDVELLEIVK